ncbi:MAG: thrombospondin type 3 repeat-containing protein [Planctomycetota bacterium]
MKVSPPLFALCLTLQSFVLLAQSPPPPQEDTRLKYYDRQKIDISNLRDFYENLLIADAMIHNDAMFDAETKWKLTLYQMIRAGSNHHQARSAYQLSLLGTPRDEIEEIWSTGYVASIKDDRTRAAFEYLNLAATLPARVTADTHAALRKQFADRQIVELFELTGINAAMATHDQILPIATDQETLDWAERNLRNVGWAPGHNASTQEEQRKNPYVGKLLSSLHNEFVADWKAGDLTARAPRLRTDYLNQITGYGISTLTFDGDQDGIEEPFDFYPAEYLRWEDPKAKASNLPSKGTPRFNVAAYDYPYFTPAAVPETKFPYSERHKLDNSWSRKSSLGTLGMDAYTLQRDRAVSLQRKWELFFVYQLASGCVHCQAHGAFGTFQEMEDEFLYDKVPPVEMPVVVDKIRSLMDFERADHLTDADKAAFRLARDAGTLPARTTAAHIEELRRHYSDREIQEIISTLVLTPWLSTVMQSQGTVTDQNSMSWTIKNLGPAGWNPGVHIGLPNEQRPYHMSQYYGVVFADLASGVETDAISEWLDITIPLGVDSDRDGVEDGFDGFPNDSSRWADTDGDGIEDSSDSDIDGDGISNSRELTAGTFPYKADSDGDGISDPDEAEAGTNPLDPRNLKR